MGIPHARHRLPPGPRALLWLLSAGLIAGCGTPAPRTPRAPPPPPWSDTTKLTPLLRPAPAPRPRPAKGCEPLTGDRRRWKMPVRSVGLRGLQGAQARAARKAIALLPQRPYRQFIVAADVRRIWALGTVRRVWVEACRAGSEVDITYVVKSEVTLRRIWLQVRDPQRRGWSRKPVPRLRRVHAGAPLSRDAVRAALESLRAAYRQRGHYHASITPYLRRIAPGQAELILQIFPGPRVLVGTVRFVGNRAIHSKMLQESMQTQPFGLYRPGILEMDLVRIRAAYFDRGYINVRVRAPRTTLSAGQRFLNLTIPLEEGARFRLGKVDLRGDLLATGAAGTVTVIKDRRSPAYGKARQRQLGRVQCRSGQAFNRSRLARDLVTISDEYKNHGYAYANVVPITHIDLTRRRIDVTLEIESKEPVTIETIRVAGNRRVPTHLIRSLLDVGVGDRYSQTRMQASRKRLLALGVFKRVDFTWQAGHAKDRIRLSVAVQE